jgi:hypothetical protein
MKSSHSRRRFLRDTAAGALAATGALRFVSRLPVVNAADVRLEPGAVHFRPEIEPVVRLLEDTPRDRLLGRVAERIRGGLGYKDLLAALLLAGVRNIQPRPVGFKFHAVLVVHSAHLASLASSGGDRWLPIFWALDYFKEAQARDVTEGEWTMGPASETRVPGPALARRAFVEAMDDWDEPKADAAVTGFARHARPDELFEVLCRYGARDFRDLGHKAIYVANGWRALGYVGWEHAEPVSRSIAYALLDHEGDNPARRDAAPDRPWRRNLGLAAQIRHELRGGEADVAATSEMLSLLRRASPEEACDAVVDRLKRRAAAQPVWDALFLAAAELLMRRPGIVSLHAVTTANALHYAFETSTDDGTRKLLLLQGAAFATLFRGQPGPGGVEIDRFEPRALEAAPDRALDEVFADVSGDPAAAAAKVLTYLRDHRRPEELMAAARRLVFLKGNDSHDYKLSSAMLEDFDHVSAAWRGRYLAAAVFLLPGSGAPDNDIARRTREAFGGA